jgi:3-hydroxyacyl-CoA dehydrogenase
MSTVTFSKRGSIGVITIDNPPVNALSHSVRAGLRDALATGLADAAVTALVLVCAGRTFIVGADIREFGQPPREPKLAEVVEAIENSAKPVIAAIHGSALGGGLEVALACHFRVALADAKIGLPEVKLGLLPGCGGTQRLPRLIGVEAALKLIVEGNPLAAPAAAELGAIDAIVSGDLTAAAAAFAEQVVAERRPLRKVSELPIALDNPAVFDEAEKTAGKKRRGYIAPQYCIQAVRAACELPFAAGLQRERELFVELLNSNQSKALRHLFNAEREVVRVPGLAEDTPVRKIAAVAVIGPGVMGNGIAICCANAGIPVHLLGATPAKAEAGLAQIGKIYASSVRRGSLSQQDMERRLALITPTASYADCADADLVIEAVREDMDTKQAVFRALDAACKPGAILATNTSYLNIDDIAAVTARPQDVVGMHFFNPANVMKLLENVRAARTAPDVLATVMAFGKTLGKLPILVGVSDGFLVNRMLAKRSREGFFMLEEGATPWQIDKVLYAFGFPMGPYSLADLAGLDVAWTARKARFDKLTGREQVCNILDKICELNRFGQKSGAGYYRYDEQRKATPDPLIEELIAQHSRERGIARRAISDQEIEERCIYALINEGAKILEEGIAARPIEVDIAWVHGLGFPAYLGGPLFYADQIGLRKVYETMLRYRDQVGAEYWTPAPLLERLAKEGKGFYG